MKKYTITCLMVIAGIVTTYAQSLYAVQYTVNFPLGNTNDFISKTSWRGATFDYRYKIQPNIGVGFSVGWYTFYEKKDYDTYSTSDDMTAVSGTQYRYLNSVPVLVVADYFLSPGESISPFVGLGIGTTYNRVDNDMGMYTIRYDPWQFTLAPEAGVRFGMRSGAWAFISARYNHSFEASSLDAQSYLSLNVGLMFGND